MKPASPARAPVFSRVAVQCENEKTLPDIIIVAINVSYLNVFVRQRYGIFWNENTNS